LEEETPKGKRRISIEEAPVKKSKKEKQSPKTPKDSPKKTGDANSCVTCNKSFSTPEALSQHKNFKHGTPSPVEKKKKEEGKKKEEEKKVKKVQKPSKEQKDSENGTKGEEKKAKKKKKKSENLNKQK